MAASTTLKLSPVEREIAQVSLLEEFRTLARAIVEEDIPYAPIEPLHMADALWKLQHMTAIVRMLEEIGFMEPRSEDGN